MHERALAKTILAYESGGVQDTRYLAQAAEQSALRLGPLLERLLGPSAFRVALERALGEASTEYPFLAPVHPLVTKNTCWTGLFNALENQDLPLAEDATAAILANLIGLISSSIGDDMAARQIRALWPQLAAKGAEEQGGTKENLP